MMDSDMRERYRQAHNTMIEYISANESEGYFGYYGFGSNKGEGIKNLLELIKDMKKEIDRMEHFEKMCNLLAMVKSGSISNGNLYNLYFHKTLTQDDQNLLKRGLL